MKEYLTTAIFIILCLIITTMLYLMATPVVCGISNKIYSGPWEEACGQVQDFTHITY